MRPLEGQVAVVAGATRGAGRGVARMLGEAGAIVYCTGRSVRGEPSVGHAYSGRPETIDETAELVTAAGGTGIPVRTDHYDEEQVKALFARVRGEQGGRLDVLVNAITGQPVKSWSPFWKLSLDEGRAMVDSWLWPHLTTCRHAVPLMVKRGSGLIVEVLEHDSLGYHAQLYYDLAIVSIKRLMYDLAEELAPKGVSALTVAPGFMRTEAILDDFGATEANWREVAEQNARARSFGFAGSETPCFVGRAIAALAADPELPRKSGGIYSSWGLSDEYGFTDVDGGRPHWGRYGAEHFPHLFRVAPASGARWTVERPAAEAPAAGVR